MKWKKYQDLVKKYPFIKDEVQLLGIRFGNSKEFVKKCVEFIAFRPFASLDLGIRSTFICQSEPGSTFFPTKRYQMVEFSILIAIGAESERITLDTGGNDIQTAIDLLIEFINTEEPGKQITWKHITKKSVYGSNASDASQLVNRVIIEIYQFPPFYRATPPPPEAISPPSAAHLAYISGEPMPPIIPGSLNFAG